MVHHETAVGTGPPTSEPLAQILAKGRPFPAGPGDALVALLGTPVGREGLSRFYQPGFPGIRTFVVQCREAADRSVDFTVVGIARDGMPAWTGERAIARGRDGSLEVHHQFDEVSEVYRSRNVLSDSVQRELDLLGCVGCGPGARITADARGATGYLAALHGFVFADETDEGPPVRSARALEPDGDRAAIIEAAGEVIARVTKGRPVSAEAIAAATEQIRAATSPAAIARVELPSADLAVPDGERDFAGGLGRALLADVALPPPIHIGGRGLCAGLGSMVRSRNW